MTDQNDTELAVSDEPSELDAILGDLPEETISAAYIRVQSSMAGVRDIPVEAGHITTSGLPGYTLQEVLALGNLTWNQQTQFFAGETQVDLSYVVPVNSTVTAVGVLKGGA